MKIEYNWVKFPSHWRSIQLILCMSQKHVLKHAIKSKPIHCRYNFTNLFTNKRILLIFTEDT